MNLDNMIAKILEEVKVVDNKIQFTEESRKLIHEAALECEKLSVYKANKEKSTEYAKGLSAEDVYVDMLHKIAGAPTQLHVRFSARLLLPVIDQKLQERKTDNQ